MKVDNNTKNEISFLLRPVGYKKPSGDSKSITKREIREWINKENPHLIKRLPNFSFYAFSSMIAGVILGLLGIKKDNSFCKWTGSILGLIGIVSSGFSIYFGKVIGQILEEKDKADKKQDEKKDKKEEYYFKVPLTTTLGIIATDLSEGQRKESINKLIQEHRDNIDGFKSLLEKIKSEHKDKKIQKEAENCLEAISEKEKAVPEAISCFQDKNATKKLRWKAIDILGEAYWKLKDTAALQALTECAKDKSDNLEVREEALEMLTDHNNVNLFFNILTDSDDNVHVREVAKIQLEKLVTNGNEEIIERCRNLVSSDDPLVNGLINTAIDALEARNSKQFPEEEFENIIINSLQNILTEKDEKIRELIREKIVYKRNRKDDFDKLKTTLEKIKSNHKDKKIQKEAENCLSFVHKEEKKFTDAPNCLKDKNKSTEEHKGAIDIISDLGGNNTPKLLSECIKNKDLESSVRTYALNALWRTDLSKAIEVSSSVISGKDDDPKMCQTLIKDLESMLKERRHGEEVSDSLKEQAGNALLSCIKEKTNDSTLRNFAFKTLDESLYIEHDHAQLLEISVEILKDKNEKELHELASEIVGRSRNKNIGKVLKKLYTAEKQRYKEKKGKQKGQIDDEENLKTIRYLGRLIMAIQSIDKGFKG